VCPHPNMTSAVPRRAGWTSLPDKFVIYTDTSELHARSIEQMADLAAQALNAGAKTIQLRAISEAGERLLTSGEFLELLLAVRAEDRLGSAQPAA
jgi:hypothetical protein